MHEHALPQRQDIERGVVVAAQARATRRAAMPTDRQADALIRRVVKRRLSILLRQ